MSCHFKLRNTMNIKRIVPFVLAGLVLSAGMSMPATAQTLKVSESSTMTIYGSANVTDWEAKVKTIKGEVVLRNAELSNWEEAEATWFEQVTFSFPVADIDADSRRMNNNMHDYLKKNRHPEITYSLVEVKKLVAMDNPGFVLTVIGIVTAAGESVEIEHDVEVSVNEAGELIVSGSKDLRMTDFGIDPPTAMLGSVRARDEMTIEFNVHLK